MKVIFTIKLLEMYFVFIISISMIPISMIPISMIDYMGHR